MKLFLKIVLSIFIIFILFAAGGMFFISRGLEDGEKLIVNACDISSLEDGIYNGIYNGGRWSNETRVTVKDHKIIKIEVIKDVLFKKTDVTNTLINRVIETQNTDVDVISGATVTSKAYLKSIENALKK